MHTAYVKEVSLKGYILCNSTDTSFWKRQVYKNRKNYVHNSEGREGGRERRMNRWNTGDF